MQEEHLKKLLKSTELVFKDEGLKEDIMQRIKSQNKKKKNNYKKLARFFLGISLFLTLGFLGFFIRDIIYGLSLDIEELQLSRMSMALVFIITVFTIFKVHNGLSKDFKKVF